MPPNIGFRLQAENKYNMADLMMSLELAMAALSEINSTVVDEVVGDDYERKRSTWVAEVEIGIVGRIFQVPKTEVGKTLAAQEAELSASCAEFIASKMLELLNTRKPPLTLAYLLGIAANIKEKYSSSFWQAIVKLLEDPSLESKTDISNGKHDKKKSKAEQTLVPKVLKLDADGRPIAGHETVTKSKDQTVEQIPLDGS